jgi:peptidoglycan/LPS O-acetylase OafA/YrhL
MSLDAVELAHNEEAAPASATTAVTGRHLPALNGLRGLAVIGVFAYHLQLGWASGGYLGVDLFFVLSGFLITTLLLEEWVRNGRISLGSFWGRRAKRLLPALFMVVAALGLYLICNAIFGGPGANGLIDLSGLRGDAIWTLLYANNWHLIYAHQSYFAQFSTPSPLQHTWSLAIEEQFYLVWPLVLLLLFRLAKVAWRRVGVIVTITLGVASSVLMALLFHPGLDPSRIYYGTDTRLFDLMAGATLAFVAAARPQPGRQARRTLHTAGPLAALALGVFWVVSGTAGGLPKNYMFEGGFLLCAALAALVVADARLVQPGRFARLLGTRPLHFMGTISYGVYLWHWPVIVYLNGARTGLSTWPLDLLRVGVTLVVSTASYYLVERPIRLAKLHGPLRWWLGPIAGIATAVLVIVATFPAVADPSSVVGTTRLSTAAGASVPGSGGYSGQQDIKLATAPTTANPLRVVVLGDSVMQDASYGITAALGATGEANVQTNTIDGFGLTTATNWPHSIPLIISQEHPQLIVGSWSWDSFGPSRPNALYQPKQYTALLKRAVSVMLTPGNGVEGVIFTQFPQSGDVPAGNGESTKSYDKVRREGVDAWNNIAKEMTTLFPGRVMYFPLASSLMLDGTKYSSWLPPENDPRAPRDQWIRVRKLDNLHLCPEGSARYADALLADMTAVFKLAPAQAGWSQEAWTQNPDFNDPPGACPDDHPPG